MYDLKSEKFLQHFHGHIDKINSIELDESGIKLLTTSEDGSVRVWNIANAQLETIYNVYQSLPLDIATMYDNKIYAANSLTI